MQVRIEDTWHSVLRNEFDKPYFEKLAEFVKKEYRKGVVYPSAKNIFGAFDLCPFDMVKVVVLGQDPYHGAGQAHGLSFSVVAGVAVPPSLQNIYKEIYNDLQIPISKSGDLTRWAKQGVFLLNSTLTVLANLAGSHQNRGWEEFTDSVIRIISNQKKNVVFLLWGNYAIQKSKLIDKNKHLVLSAPHPSPLSSYRGFFGCQHFSKANEYLKNNNISPIDWS